MDTHPRDVNKKFYPVKLPKFFKMTPNLVCRTCLTDRGDLVEVFSDCGEELALVIKLKDHLNLEDDEIDKNTAICYKCVNLLNDFDEMFRLVQSTRQGTSMPLPTQYLEILDTDTTDQMIDVNYEEVVVEENETVVIMEEDPEMVDYEEVETAEEAVDELPEIEEEEVVEQVITRSTAIRNSQKKTSTSEGRKQADELQEQRNREDELIRSEISLSCHECSAVGFNTFSEVKDHFRIEHNMEGFVTCCDRVFKRRLKLLEHIKLHLNPNAFECKVCQRAFREDRQLKTHMGSHVPVEERQFQCEKCPKKFDSNPRLQAHIKCHNEDYSFQCEHCDKSFKQKANLDGHIRFVHNPIRMYVCEICAREFKTKDSLTLHQANHLETPLPRETCPLCGDKFKNRLSLNQHLIRHKRANEVYSCNICNKNFKSKKWVTQHRKHVHGAPQFKCTECDKAFKRAINLKEHMAQHTGKSLYTCKYCPKEFKSNANMYSHQKAQHPGEWKEEVYRRKKA